VNPTPTAPLAERMTVTRDHLCDWDDRHKVADALLGTTCPEVRLYGLFPLLAMPWLVCRRVEVMGFIDGQALLRATYEGPEGEGDE
jgi:hypothetical protein